MQVLHNVVTTELYYIHYVYCTIVLHYTVYCTIVLLYYTVLYTHMQWMVDWISKTERTKYTKHSMQVFKMLSSPIIKGAFPPNLSLSLKSTIYHKLIGNMKLYMVCHPIVLTIALTNYICPTNRLYNNCSMTRAM